MLSGGAAGWPRGGGPRVSGHRRCGAIAVDGMDFSRGCTAVMAAGAGSGSEAGTSVSPLRLDTTATSIVVALNADPCVRCSGAWIGSEACSPIAARSNTVHTRMRKRKTRSNATATG